MSTPLTAPNGVGWTQPTGLFINNAFIPSSTGQTLTTTNPSTAQEICSVQAATAPDVSTAVSAARAAFPSWAATPGTSRGHLMTRLASLVSQHAETLAVVETLDSGKPLSATRAFDVPHFVDVLRYYAGWADKSHGTVVASNPAKMAYTLRQPLGVCAQIIPWNYPLGMAAWKLGPALACGNTVVLKLAELTPLSMLVVASLVKEAGFPPGVVNVINGTGGEAGAALVRHPDVDKVAFTGSTATGREVMKMAAGTLKNVTLETGGKSPLIVFGDADLAQAVKWAHVGIMDNQGQICSATSRILVHESVHDEFVDAFKRQVRHVSVVGDPFDEETFQGPQISAAQQARVNDYIQTGLDEGATMVMGGTAHPTGGKGYHVQPTVFTDVKPGMRIHDEEIFGPVVVVVKFRGEEEALRVANDSVYGLGAAVFTRDLARAHRVAAGVQAGSVWVNSTDDADYRAPFGGVKQSGVGRELGEEGLGGYFCTKAVHVNLSGE